MSIHPRFTGSRTRISTAIAAIVVELHAVSTATRGGYLVGSQNIRDVREQFRAAFAVPGVPHAPTWACSLRDLIPNRTIPF